MSALRLAAALVTLAPTLLLASCELLVGIEDRSVARDASGGDAVLSGADAGDERILQTPDAGESARDADAGPPDLACFRSVALVASLSSPSTWEHSVRFTANGLGAYLTRAPLPPDDLRQADVLYATRSSPSSPFGAFAPTSFTRSDVGDFNATETQDGRTVYFDTYLHADPCPNCRHVWRATRASPSDPWSTPEQVVASPDNEDLEPYALADGSAVYFVTSRDSHPFGLWRAKPGATFDIAPVAGDRLDVVDQAERAPVVTPDDLALYFARSAPPYTMFVATRTDTSSPFSAPRPLVLHESPAPSPHDELPTWISADGCDLYFRDDRTGDMDIWSARRCDCP